MYRVYRTLFVLNMRRFRMRRHVPSDFQREFKHDSFVLLNPEE